MAKLTAAQQQADYDQRKQRCNDGIGSDDDRRLVKLYESEGFETSRAIRERLAKDAARETRAQSVVEDDDEDDDGPNDGRLTERSKVGEWRVFADTVNDHLAESERPIGDPAHASKRDLIEKYSGYMQASVQE